MTSDSSPPHATAKAVESDDGRDPRDQSALSIDRAFLREIWRLQPAHRELHKEALIEKQLPVFGFRPGSSAPEPDPVTTTSSDDIDWHGPREGENWGPCAANGKGVFHRLFIDPAGWSCPMCAGNEVRSPVSKQKGRPGPKTARYQEADCALLQEVIRLRKEQNLSPWAACNQLGEEGQIVGHGTPKSKAKRLLGLYMREIFGKGK